MLKEHKDIMRNHMEAQLEDAINVAINHVMKGDKWALKDVKPRCNFKRAEHEEGRGQFLFDDKVLLEWNFCGTIQTIRKNYKENK